MTITPPVPDFVEQARLDAKRDGVPLHAAMSKVARERPALYAEHVERLHTNAALRYELRRGDEKIEWLERRRRH